MLRRVAPPPCVGMADAAAPGAEHVRADVTYRDALRGADGVFHLAALASAAGSAGRQAECERVNVGGTRSVLGAADRAGAPVVLASSAAVYGSAPGGARMPLAEDAACAPASPYGATKLACERLLASTAERGLPPPPPPAAVSLRLFIVYGPAPAGSAGAGVVARFAARLSSRLPLVVSGGRLQVRDFVHVGDVARAFEAAMRLALSPAARGPAAGPAAAWPSTLGRGGARPCSAWPA